MFDNSSTSIGGSVISDNRIYEPNQSGSQASYSVEGAFGPLGDAYGCGITVLGSFGLTIARNTINDDQSKMVYSMQLAPITAPPAQIVMERILVEGNLCGSAPGVGNGTKDTFYIGTNETANNPWPILRNNTNQLVGYDQTASLSIASGVPWPSAQGYPYDVLVTVNANTGGTVEIDGTVTPFPNGVYFLKATHTITVTWQGEPAPQISVFRM